ncbi:MAG: hypothetical protein EOO27_02355 [Comamonadaceae bacterium]|nr:MAG: hypothetical protein EOO27_02355 [Comamonadaceae bacterium]
MIDIGRRHDLLYLQQAINNENLPVFKRRQAHMALERIRATLKDKYISTQRLRLIAANRVDDSNEVEKISKRVQDYEKRNNMRRKH